MWWCFQNDYPPPAIGRIYALNKPELPIMIIGGISAMLQGCIFPSLAVLFGEILGVSIMTAQIASICVLT